MPDGSLHWFGKECRIGRAKDVNDLVIEERAISSRHVQLVCGPNGYFLVDQHSTNGTYLNGLLVQKAVELKDGDEIRLAKVVTLRFRCTREFKPAAAGPVDYEQTTAQVIQVEAHDCWLLLLDVAGYSALIADLGSEAALQHLQQWIGEVRPLIENNAGSINSYIGDAILAYWPSKSRTSQQVMGALSALEAYRANSPVNFRIVMHHGIVLFSRSDRGQEMSGQDVNFIFRSEKIAKKFGCTTMLSQAAVQTLKIENRCDQAGISSVDGIAGQFAFYRLRESSAHGAPTSPPQRRILLVDETQEADPRLKGLFESHPEAGSYERGQHGSSARKLHTKLRPELIIIDLSQRTGEVLTLIRDLIAAYAETRVLVLGTSRDAGYVNRALRAGARGFALKSDSDEALLKAIQTVVDGGLFLGANITDSLLPLLPGHVAGNARSVILSLSETELNVLRGFGRGQMSREIAEKLSVAKSYVDQTQESLRSKLQLGTTSQLASAARSLLEESSSSSDSGT